MSEFSQLTPSLSQPAETKNGFTQALVDSFPLSISVFAYGLAYGALAHTTNHLSIVQTLAMSVFVFAGASQFLVLALLHQGTTVATIIGSAFLLNSRQMLYGFSLGPFLRHIKLGTLAILSHGLTDESFSITFLAAKQRIIPASYFAGAGTMVFFPWLISSAAGFAIGGLIGDPQRFGLDFAYIGAFLGLLMAQLQVRRQVAAVLLAAVVAVGGYQLYGTTGAVLSGAIAAFLIGVTSHESIDG